MIFVNGFADNFFDPGLLEIKRNQYTRLEIRASADYGNVYIVNANSL